MGIDRVKVRAEVSFLGGSTIKTPYVISFTVTKNRGSYSTASISLKVTAEDIPSVGGLVTIAAGESGRLNKIFTGIIIDIKPTPVWDDPSYVNLNLNCADALYLLTDKKFTRRQVSHEQSWALITGVRPGVRSGRFNSVNAPSMFFSGEASSGGDFIGGTIPPPLKESVPSTSHVKLQDKPMGALVTVKTGGK
jgi:hypothetical protein